MSRISQAFWTLPACGGKRAAPAASFFAVIVVCSGALHAQERAGSASITVERLIIDAWITDYAGNPLEDLRPQELRVRIGGLPAEVEAVDFYRADQLRESVAGEEEGRSPPAPGRLFVYFFQTDFARARARGQIRMMDHARGMLESLAPEDRVAVVSYDSHLKLLQDFTRDSDLLEAAINRSIRIGPTPEHHEQEPPSLAAVITRERARRAAKPEQALIEIARALEEIDGPKVLVWFGWGLGRYGMGGVAHEPEWARARFLLERSRTSMFVLDTTDADYHSLEVALRDAAEKTGGLYQQTFRLADQAVSRFERTVSGRYEISAVVEDLARGIYPVTVELVGRRGRVLTRSTYELR